MNSSKPEHYEIKSQVSTSAPKIISFKEARKLALKNSAAKTKEWDDYYEKEFKDVFSDFEETEEIGQAFAAINKILVEKYKKRWLFGALKKLINSSLNGSR